VGAVERAGADDPAHAPDARPDVRRVRLAVAADQRRSRLGALVDIEEQDDAYVLEAELPGVKREDVNIEVVGNELSITGEIREKEHKGALRRRTRRTGHFEYRVRLPEQVDASNIEASLDQGVLTIHVPKSERAQRQKIEIKSK
jgi:HSP20 family protein